MSEKYLSFRVGGLSRGKNISPKTMLSIVATEPSQCQEKLTFSLYLLLIILSLKTETV